MRPFASGRLSDLSPGSGLGGTRHGDRMVTVTRPACQGVVSGLGQVCQSVGDEGIDVGGVVGGQGGVVGDGELVRFGPAFFCPVGASSDDVGVVDGGELLVHDHAVSAAGRVNDLGGGECLSHDRDGQMFPVRVCLGEVEGQFQVGDSPGVGGNDGIDYVWVGEGVHRNADLARGRVEDADQGGLVLAASAGVMKVVTAVGVVTIDMSGLRG